MLISWARGMSPVTLLLPFSLSLCVAIEIVSLRDRLQNEYRYIFMRVCMKKQKTKTKQNTRVCLWRGKPDHDYLLQCSPDSPQMNAHTSYTDIFKCVCVCEWALWLLTRERVFWLMMIHEINFNSYDQRLFAFEMKAFSHRFTFDPLAPSVVWQWRSMLKEKSY